MQLAEGWGTGTDPAASQGCSSLGFGTHAGGGASKPWALPALPHAASPQADPKGKGHRRPLSWTLPAQPVGLK